MKNDNERASDLAGEELLSQEWGVDRRSVLKSITGVSTVAIAGCAGAGTDDSQDEGPPPKEEGVKKWGQRVNEYCREAGIDWKQFEGTSLIFGMNVHPFTETTSALLPYFEELTGISVQYNTFPEDQLWQKLTLDLNSETGVFDGFFLGLWPSARYHNNGWVKDLNEFMNDSSLTNKDWYHMEDYPESAISAYTYGDDDLVALPFGIEAYGCLAYDQPTFETLGLEPPEDYPSMLEAAKTIHESDEVDRAGICSRASSTTLSSANWATMFKSNDADWLDYDAKEATLNSKEGIVSLEMFAEMMGDYGPADIGTFDWYKSNQAFGNGQVGMCYHTPAAAGVFTDEQYERTEWIAPVPGPNGSQIASTWEWGLGISEFTDNPGAAWLLLQWLTCRPMNLLVSSKQWQGIGDYGHARSNWLFDQPEYQDRGQKQSWIEAHNKGMEMVPSDPPPVPLHTPQNMDIMTEAAIAMNAAVTDNKSAEQALNDAAPKITEYAKQIPDEYLNQ
jgi:multiple sugar transport system substrate-binding protein